MNPSLIRYASYLVAFAVVQTLSLPTEAARPVVPGTGTLIDYVGDDFEDASWDFKHNFPKSSREQDSRLRSPTGRSLNGRWIEGPERGQPDYMQVVPTPAGGLAGSNYALLMQTLNSGIPGRHLNNVQQDDLIANCISRIGTISPSEIPSVVTRVYLPPADEWENRSGPHFGFRISASTVTTEKSSGFFGGRSETKAEPYWPGIWIHFRSKTSRRTEKDSAFLTIRGNRMGRDVRYKEIPEEQFGWWTFGMSITGDGQIHYYAKPGVEDLTAADHITSQFPYSYKAQRFRTFFFDVCNKDDGKSWSTPFVIDDTRLYVVNDARIAAVVNRKMQREAKRKAQQNAKVARKPKSKR
ncbi:MAG: hypothetical protein IH897_12550 [Planctomycetes bacterium]|nr:hypothetical protein [Planctomycetota bacterium]